MALIFPITFSKKSTLIIIIIIIESLIIIIIIIIGIRSSADLPPLLVLDIFGRHNASRTASDT